MKLARWPAEYQNRKSGISMIEVLIVVAILAILVLIAMQLFTKYIPRSRDARRKADLNKIKIAFEDYHNDNGCYPEPTILDNCDSGDLSPYLPAVPCDPLYETPYVYLPLPDQCSGYRVLSRLEDPTDSIISSLHCEVGCGGIPSGNPAYEISSSYVYGISENTPVSEVEFDLEEGWICPVPGGDCNACEPSGGGCGGHSEVFADYSGCIAATECIKPEFN